MTNPTPLSGRAQAILDAVCDNTEPDCDIQHLIAAALRAAVEQCAYKREIHPDSLIAEMIIEADDILAIADELEQS